MDKDKELEDEIKELEKWNKETKKKGKSFQRNMQLSNLYKLEYLKAELKGRKDKAKEILDFINKERNEGNCEPVLNYKSSKKAFSPSLCLSKIIKMLEDSNNE